MDKNSKGKGTKSSKSFLPPNTVAKSISLLCNLDSKLRSKDSVPLPVRKHLRGPYEQMQAKIFGGEYKGNRIQIPSTCKSSHHDLDNNVKDPKKPPSLGKFLRGGSGPKLPSTASILNSSNNNNRAMKHSCSVIFNQPSTSQSQSRFLGKFPKLETRTEPRPRSKPSIQSIPLRNSLPNKETPGDSGVPPSMSEKRPGRSNLGASKTSKILMDPLKSTKGSPYKNQLPSIYNPTTRPRSKQIKDSGGHHNTGSGNTEDTGIKVTPFSKRICSPRTKLESESAGGGENVKPELSRVLHDKLTGKDSKSRVTKADGGGDHSPEKVERSSPPLNKSEGGGGGGGTIPPPKVDGKTISNNNCSGNSNISGSNNNKLKIPSQPPTINTRPRTGSSSPSSSSRPVLFPPTNSIIHPGSTPNKWTDIAEANFSAVLQQTMQVIEGVLEASSLKEQAQKAATTVHKSVEGHPGEHGVNNYQDELANKMEALTLDNIDNLPFPFPQPAGSPTQSSEKTMIINPPVNTPVSPKSPISDTSDLDLSPVPYYKKSSDSEEEEETGSSSKLWKDIELDHDFVTDYLQLESMKEVNYIAQAMCRAKICREVKGADPNLTLEELKLSKSHYLQLPCFADPKFFTKMKIPLKIFMNGKKPDPDLLTIQYLQNKMDTVYHNNLKAFETSRKGNGTQTSSGTASPDHNGKSLKSLSVDVNLCKDKYVQSIAKLFQSLQLPQWAKECFGSGSEEDGFTSNEEDVTLTSQPPETKAGRLLDSGADRTALAKRILNMFENGKLKKLSNVDKTSRLKKKALPKDYEDDTSSDNISESP